MEAVKELKGCWHYTLGFDKGTLRTICGKGILPDFRLFEKNDVLRIVDCPKCRKLLTVDKGNLKR